MKKLMLFSIVFIGFIQAKSQTSMPVNYFQVEDYIYVQAQAVSTNSLLKYYSTPGGGKLLSSQSPNTTGYTEKIFDKDHAPAFVLNNGTVVHLTQKMFILKNLEYVLDNGTLTFSFEASVSNKDNTHFELLKTSNSNGFSLVNSFSCSANNTNQSFTFSETPNANDVYFLQAISNSNALYTSDALSTQLAAKGIGTNNGEVNNHDLQVYPTLATQLITVSITTLHTNQGYTIFNTLGQVVQKGPLKSLQTDIDISTLSTGKYIFITKNTSIGFNKL